MSGVQKAHVLNKGDHGVRSPVDDLQGNGCEKSRDLLTQKEAVHASAFM